MTEKPFNVNLDFVYDKEGNLYSLQDCCDLLNSQYETILMQRKEIKSWIRYVHELEVELRKQGEMI